jgi:heme-degrading monooxygenase HmoA
MYMVIRRWTVQGMTPEEFIRDLREKFLPAVSAIEGFISYEVLQEGEHSFSTVSVFNSRDGAAESTRRASECVQQHAGGGESRLVRREVLQGAVVLHREASFVA